MARRLSTATSAISLLLCMAVLALWARSYFVVDDVYYWTWWHGAGVLSIRGRIVGSAMTAPPPGGIATAMGLHWDPGSIKPSASLPQPTGPLYWPGWRIGLGTFTNPLLIEHRLSVPHAWLAALLAIVPIRWAILRRGRSRFADGLCPNCAYDLRASTGRCPECGAQIT